MPTEMKNRPSSRPLKGSMFASSSWRYSESARSTPARNAPSDIDSPTPTMSSETPSTTSKAAAVKISWIPASAIVRRIGRSSNRPPTITTMITVTAFAAASHGLPDCAMLGAVASSGMSASSGMTVRSWNNKMANAERPYRVVSCLRSARTCNTNAVEDMARPRPITSALCQL